MRTQKNKSSQKVKVYKNGIWVGNLYKEVKNGKISYRFRYYPRYFNNPTTQAISLSLPKTNKNTNQRYSFSLLFWANLRRLLQGAPNEDR
ncbi:HipA N-terminal domain-containing protein [Thermoflexibacter ruber]|uniref:HipA N-terminal domain-containing protein n=1 Tax=Thermoflexibacter ruber TaxID=1003 RepID=A0A1I2GUW7_9BACT|nr:HipA N-terminal domain-containing protein [Thermoflexibacter ruber]SFF20953.1 HipA N-terminal domain-containing protein [Thermoflexibacter ruber]